MESKLFLEADELLKAEAVSRILKTSKSYPYKLAELGMIPVIKIPQIGNSNRFVLRFKRSDVLEFIEKHYQK